MASKLRDIEAIDRSARHSLSAPLAADFGPRFRWEARLLRQLASPCTSSQQLLALACEQGERYGEVQRLCQAGPIWLQRRYVGGWSSQYGVLLGGVLCVYARPEDVYNPKVKPQRIDLRGFELDPVAVPLPRDRCPACTRAHNVVKLYILLLVVIAGLTSFFATATFLLVLLLVVYAYQPGSGQKVMRTGTEGISMLRTLWQIVLDFLGLGTGRHRAPQRGVISFNQQAGPDGKPGMQLRLCVPSSDVELWRAALPRALAYAAQGGVYHELAQSLTAAAIAQHPAAAVPGRRVNPVASALAALARLKVRLTAAGASSDREPPPVRERMAGLPRPAIYHVADMPSPYRSQAAFDNPMHGKKGSPAKGSPPKRSPDRRKSVVGAVITPPAAQHGSNPDEVAGPTAAQLAQQVIALKSRTGGGQRWRMYTSDSDPTAADILSQTVSMLAVHTRAGAAGPAAGPVESGVSDFTGLGASTDRAAPAGQPSGPETAPDSPSDVIVLDSNGVALLIGQAVMPARQASMVSRRMQMLALWTLMRAAEWPKDRVPSFRAHFLLNGGLLALAEPSFLRVANLQLLLGFLKAFGSLAEAAVSVDDPQVRTDVRTMLSYSSTTGLGYHRQSVRLALALLAVYTGPKATRAVDAQAGLVLSCIVQLLKCTGMDERAWHAFMASGGLWQAMSLQERVRLEAFRGSLDGIVAGWARSEVALHQLACVPAYWATPAGKTNWTAIDQSTAASGTSSRRLWFYDGRPPSPQAGDAPAAMRAPGHGQLDGQVSPQLALSKLQLLVDRAGLGALAFTSTSEDGSKDDSALKAQSELLAAVSSLASSTSSSTSGSRPRAGSIAIDVHSTSNSSEMIGGLYVFALSQSAGASPTASIRKSKRNACLHALARGMTATGRAASTVASYITAAVVWCTAGLAVWELIRDYFQVLGLLLQTCPGNTLDAIRWASGGASQIFSLDVKVLSWRDNTKGVDPRGVPALLFLSILLVVLLFWAFYFSTLTLSTSADVVRDAADDTHSHHQQKEQADKNGQDKQLHYRRFVKAAVVMLCTVYEPVCRAAAMFMSCHPLVVGLINAMVHGSASGVAGAPAGPAVTCTMPEGSDTPVCDCMAWEGHVPFLLAVGLLVVPFVLGFPLYCAELVLAHRPRMDGPTATVGLLSQSLLNRQQASNGVGYVPEARCLYNTCGVCKRRTAHERAAAHERDKAYSRFLKDDAKQRANPLRVLYDQFSPSSSLYRPAVMVLKLALVLATVTAGGKIKARTAAASSMLGLALLAKVYMRPFSRKRFNLTDQWSTATLLLLVTIAFAGDTSPKHTDIAHGLGQLLLTLHSLMIIVICVSKLWDIKSLRGFTRRYLLCGRLRFSSGFRTAFGYSTDLCGQRKRRFDFSNAVNQRYVQEVLKSQMWKALWKSCLTVYFKDQPRLVARLDELDTAAQELGSDSKDASSPKALPNGQVVASTIDRRLWAFEDLTMYAQGMDVFWDGAGPAVRHHTFFGCLYTSPYHAVLVYDDSDQYVILSGKDLAKLRDRNLDPAVRRVVAIRKALRSLDGQTVHWPCLANVPLRHVPKMVKKDTAVTGAGTATGTGADGLSVDADDIASSDFSSTNRAETNVAVLFETGILRFNQPCNTDAPTASFSFSVHYSAGTIFTQGDEANVRSIIQDKRDVVDVPSVGKRNSRKQPGGGQVAGQGAAQAVDDAAAESTASQAELLAARRRTERLSVAAYAYVVHAATGQSKLRPGGHDPDTHVVARHEASMHHLWPAFPTAARAVYPSPSYCSGFCTVKEEVNMYMPPPVPIPAEGTDVLNYAVPAPLLFMGHAWDPRRDRNSRPVDAKLQGFVASADWYCRVLPKKRRVFDTWPATVSRNLHQAFERNLLLLAGTNEDGSDSCLARYLEREHHSRVMRYARLIGREALLSLDFHSKIYAQPRQELRSLLQLLQYSPHPVLQRLHEAARDHVGAIVSHWQWANSQAGVGLWYAFWAELWLRNRDVLPRAPAVHGALDPTRPASIAYFPVARPHLEWLLSQVGLRYQRKFRGRIVVDSWLTDGLLDMLYERLASVNMVFTDVHDGYMEHLLQERLLHWQGTVLDPGAVDWPYPDKWPGLIRQSLKQALAGLRSCWKPGKQHHQLATPPSHDGPEVRLLSLAMRVPAFRMAVPRHGPSQPFRFVAGSQWPSDATGARRGSIENPGLEEGKVSAGSGNSKDEAAGRTPFAARRTVASIYARAKGDRHGDRQDYAIIAAQANVKGKASNNMAQSTLDSSVEDDGNPFLAALRKVRDMKAQGSHSQAKSHAQTDTQSTGVGTGQSSNEQDSHVTVSVANPLSHSGGGVGVTSAGVTRSAAGHQRAGLDHTAVEVLNPMSAVQQPLSNQGRQPIGRTMASSVAARLGLGLDGIYAGGSSVAARPGLGLDGIYAGGSSVAARPGLGLDDIGGGGSTIQRSQEYEGMLSTSDNPDVAMASGAAKSAKGHRSRSVERAGDVQASGREAGRSKRDRRQSDDDEAPPERSVAAAGVDDGDDYDAGSMLQVARVDGSTIHRTRRPRSQAQVDGPLDGRSGAASDAAAIVAQGRTHVIGRGKHESKSISKSRTRRGDDEATTSAAVGGHIDRYEHSGRARAQPGPVSDVLQTVVTVPMSMVDHVATKAGTGLALKGSEPGHGHMGSRAYDGQQSHGGHRSESAGRSRDRSRTRRHDDGAVAAQPNGPATWEERVDEDGEVYWYNPVTNMIKWTRPW